MNKLKYKKLNSSQTQPGGQLESNGLARQCNKKEKCMEETE